MDNLATTLASVQGLPDLGAKTEQYKVVLQQVLASGSAQACQQFIDHILMDTVPLVLSRQLVQSMAQELSKLPADVHKPVATYVLEKLQPRAVSFEEAAVIIRQGLAGLLEEQEQYSRAAQVLAGIDLDAGSRADPGTRLSLNVRIAMLYLEDDDTINAESYINKAAPAIVQCKDRALELQFKACYARILDSKRKFLEAALKYYELSNSGRQGQFQSSELDEALQHALTCAVLAPAGPQRSRMLATLYKDERCERQAHFPFLEKVYLERILRPEEVASFATSLKPHQKALLPDGSTVLQRSITQHNLLSASKLYNNISIQELGSLLGLPPEKAEAVAADMIIEGRLHGHIDQVEGFIQFESKEQGSSSVEALHQWDTQIQGICNKLNDILDRMAEAGISTAA